MTKLFVYGTLKQGHSRAPALAGQTFLGMAKTLPHYRLYNCGLYPALVAVAIGQGIMIQGELWEVDQDCLFRLDEIEGVQYNLYQRQPIQLADPFQNESAESYFYQQNTKGMADLGTCW